MTFNDTREPCINYRSSSAGVKVIKMVGYIKVFKVSNRLSYIQWITVLQRTSAKWRKLRKNKHYTGKCSSMEKLFVEGGLLRFNMTGFFNFYLKNPEQWSNPALNLRTLLMFEYGRTSIRWQIYEHAFYEVSEGWRWWWLYLGVKSFLAAND